MKPVLFDSFEIVYCRETSEGIEVCEVGEFQFCTLYGCRGRKVQALGNFKSFEKASGAYHSIVGRPYSDDPERRKMDVAAMRSPAAIPLLTNRSAMLAYEVLHSFQDNSSYEDYRDGDDTPFTDLEYHQMLQELYAQAFSVPEVQEGVTTMRLTLDVHYHYDESPGPNPPPVIACAEQLQSVVTRAVDDGDLSGDHDFCVADYPYRIEHLTPSGFVQILPKE